MNKLAIVTGATSGIGRATALRLASLGYDLIITGRRDGMLLEMKQEIELLGVKAHTRCFDIRDRKTTESTMNALPEELKAVDVLVNNAGLAAGLSPIHEGDPEDWDRMIDTNIKGILNITRIVARWMTERRKGHIINIGSIAGVQTYENGSVYCASKHAVHALSQGMRIDLLKYGIKVSEIRPGMVKTEFSLVRFHGNREKADNVYKGVEPLTADDIASSVEYLVNLPPHVNVNEIEIMPLAQANAFYTFRKG